MANIHGMSDYNNNSNQNPRGGFGGQPPVLDAESQSAVGMFSVMAGQSGQVKKQPRNYHLGDFWTSTFCPNFNIFSFPFVIWALNTLIYLGVLISIPFVNDPRFSPLYPIEFLGPDPDYLNYLQAMNPYEVRYNYQFWRPFSSLFLTAGFKQYAFTTAYLLLFGFMLQATKIKFIPMLVFYLICGASGNLFGAICNPNGSIFVGATPACYAMFSGFFACFIVNWKALDAYEQIRCPLIMSFVMLTLMLMLNSTAQPPQNAINAYHVHEIWADWGGYITGMLLGLVMMPRARASAHYVGSYEKLCAKIGAGWLIVFYAILLSCYFTVYTPPKWF